MTTRTTISSIDPSGRIRIRNVYGKGGRNLNETPDYEGAREAILAVEPDEDEDDCLAEALAHVESLYGDRDDVSSITCEGWEGGYDGPRDSVLIEMRFVEA